MKDVPETGPLGAVLVNCVSVPSLGPPSSRDFRVVTPAIRYLVLVGFQTVGLWIKELRDETVRNCFDSGRFAPHTGQSSQLFIDHNHRRAQFLPAVARSALNLALTPNREHWQVSDLQVRRITVRATVDNLRNFSLTTTAEMRNLFQPLEHYSLTTDRGC